VSNSGQTIENITNSTAKTNPEPGLSPLFSWIHALFGHFAGSLALCGFQTSVCLGGVKLGPKESPRHLDRNKATKDTKRVCSGFLSAGFFEGHSTWMDGFVTLGLHSSHSREGDGFRWTAGKETCPPTDENESMSEAIPNAGMS
jgi:hypothetical protein